MLGARGAARGGAGQRGGVWTHPRGHPDGRGGGGGGLVWTAWINVPFSLVRFCFHPRPESIRLYLMVLNIVLLARSAFPF